MQTLKGRLEDERMLTGRGRYVSDWDLPGQAYAHFLRSDRAHAEIVSIDIKAAQASPGVVAVLTGKDTAKAGFKSTPNIARYPGRGGMLIKVPHRDGLANGRVRHVGQEVAFVVATTALGAQDAAEKIQVEYREVPVIVDAEAALTPGAEQLYPDIPGNLCFDYEYGDEASTNEALARAAHVTRVTLDSQRMVGNPMEPKACLVSYDDSGGNYELYTSSQGITLMRGSASGITGVPAEKIMVRAQDVGGGFGIRSDAYAEYCVAMLASKTLGKPVKWISTRSETFLSDYHGRAAKLVGELALDKDGRFLAIRINWFVNAGAYLSTPGALINTLPPGLHAINLYRIPVMYGRHRLALTNTTPTTAYRGAGRPNVSYLAERLVEEAAREMKIDRVELRRSNLIPKNAFPYQTPHPHSKYDSGDPPGLLEEALRQGDWATFEARRAEAKVRGKLRGIGCAMFIEPAGAGAAPKEEAMIKFGESGNALIYVLAGPSGQGHETVYPEVVGEALGMDPEKFTLRASDPDGPPLTGEGTIGSRSMMAHGGALLMAAREVVRKGTELAAKELEVATTDLDFAKGRYHVKGTDISIGIEDLARKYRSALDAGGEIPLPRSYPSGAHVVEVEIDPQTGVLDIERYTAVDDCGRVINHVLLEGQLHGGIAQGLGQALGEHAVYDQSSGQLLTGTFMDYPMPRADEMPEIRLFDRSIPSPGNPLGAKGAGEAGTTGAVPAVANAVIDALRPLGIDSLDFPYTPERLWRAIRSAS
jgi:carbon-monoxide dehydrogenase large subunit